MGMIARNTEADVNVIALIGERGREVLDFIEQDLGEEGLKRSVVVCATSNEPSLRTIEGRLRGHRHCRDFRDQGKKVVLMMDSVTRFARAQREVGLLAVNRRREEATRLRFLPSCPNCSSDRAIRTKARSRHFIRCSSRAMT